MANFLNSLFRGGKQQQGSFNIANGEITGDHAEPPRRFMTEPPVLHSDILPVDDYGLRGQLADGSLALDPRINMNSPTHMVRPSYASVPMRQTSTNSYAQPPRANMMVLNGDLYVWTLTTFIAQHHNMYVDRAYEVISNELQRFGLMLSYENFVIDFANYKSYHATLNSEYYDDEEDDEDGGQWNS